MSNLLWSFCWTWNNPPEDKYRQVGKFADICEYVVYGEEEGSKNHTPHLQGYAELKKRTRFNTIKKMMPEWHIEARRGTQAEAIKYCKKEARAIIKFGHKRKQGERTDLDQCRRDALEGGMRLVSQTHKLQGIKVAEKFLSYNEEARDFKPVVIWLWGPSGCGKSRLARQICEEYVSDDIYTKNDDSKWWDGYDSHECVIIDDFRDSWWKPTELYRLIDRYECRVEFKGGYRQMRAKLMVITSIQSPQMMYKDSKGEPIEQILRRIDQIQYLGNLVLAPVPFVPKVGGNTIYPSL